MHDVATGVKVYYSNRKEVSNTVFMPDGSYFYYQDGDMLRELVTDEAFYIMSEKVRVAIETFPDRAEPASVENITNAFRWLCGMLDDDDFKVTREITKSCFSDAIMKLAAASYAEDDQTVFDFLNEVYETYADQFMQFAVFVDAIASEATGIADEFQKEVVKIFETAAEGSYEDYMKNCSVRRSSKGRMVNVEVKCLDSFLQVLFFEYCRLKRINKDIKICENCGQIFIPRGRSDAKYCDRQLSYDLTKTCREVGAENKRRSEINNDPGAHMRKRELSKYYMAVKRARDSGEEYLLPGYKKSIEKIKKEYVEKVKESDTNEQMES